MNHPPSTRSSSSVLVAVVASIAALGIGIALVVGSDGPSGRDNTTHQIADVHDQGDENVVYATEAAVLDRRADGLSVSVEFPTPKPGTYLYPSPDQVPPDAEPHPNIEIGDDTNPEVFTLWMFVFNQPELCTDSACDFDDIGSDTAALGGIYQVDGRFAVDDRVDFGGVVRVGQPPNVGATLFNPVGAEVHAAVAAHGRVLSGPDLWRQLNSSVGNLTHWWAAEFLAP